MKKNLIIVISIVAFLIILIIPAYLTISIFDLIDENKKNKNADKESERAAEEYVKKYVFEKYGETKDYINSSVEYDGGTAFIEEELYVSTRFQYLGYSVKCTKDSKNDNDTFPDCTDDKPSDEIVNLAKAYALKRYGVVYNIYNSHEIHDIYGVTVTQAFTFKFENNIVTCYTDTKICNDTIPSEYNEDMLKLAVNYIVNDYKNSNFKIKSLSLSHFTHKKLSNPDKSIRTCTTFTFDAVLTGGSELNRSLEVTCYYDTKTCE